MKKIFVCFVLLCLLGGATTLLIQSYSQSPEIHPITIGFIAPLTGDVSSLGTVNRIGAELAVEEVNAAGGISKRPLKLIIEDGQCNPTTAATVGNKLITIDRVTAIIGGLCSTETSAFGPFAMQKKVIVFSHGSSAPSLSALGKYFFRSYPSDSFEGARIAEYLYHQRNVRTVGILYHISDWGSGLNDVFRKRFTELGGTIVATEGAQQESRDYRTQLAKIMTHHPDVLYMPLYAEGGIAAITQARELGVSQPIYGASAWADTKFQKETAEYEALYFTEQKIEPSLEFTKKILTRCNCESVALGTAQAYDNIMLLAKIMNTVGTDPDAIEKEMRTIQYKGISGNISFDQNGDLTSAAYVLKRLANGTPIIETEL